MARRRLYMSAGLVLGFVGLVFIGLAAMVKRTPNFYADGDMSPGPVREQLSQNAYNQYFQLGSVIADPTWNITFSANEINAFFQEDYFQIGGDANLPDGFHSPRIKMEDGRIRFGARYGSGLFSTVLSMEVNIWKVENEINKLALEIVSLEAGGLPLSTAFVLDYITALARHQNIDVNWYRHNGHPVGILRFQADQTRPTFQFDSITLKDGQITISGRATDQAVAPAPRTVSK